MNAFKLAPVAAVAALALLPIPASAQSARTWVSGTGDDQLPCSRTAPCKTWFGAYTKTNAGGEITALDAGGFGSLTIAKALTISGYGAGTSILGTGTNGLIINASATDRVTIRNVKINGSRTGVDGVRVIAAGMVRLDDVNIHGFATGVRMIPAAGQTRLSMSDSRIHHNSGSGVVLAPTNAAIARATIKRSDIDDNGDGIVADGTAGRAAVNLVRSEVTDSGVPGGTATGIALRAVRANGIFRLSGNDIVGNLVGVRPVNGGLFYSAGDNFIADNGDDGSIPTLVAKK